MASTTNWRWLRSFPIVLVVKDEVAIFVAKSSFFFYISGKDISFVLDKLSRVVGLWFDLAVYFPSM